MEIEIATAERSSGCLVRLGEYELSFKTRSAAEAFAKQLQERVNAPHQLPERSSEMLPLSS